MRKLKKKICLTCATAMICASAVGFGSCSRDFLSLDDMETASFTFYVIGYFDGIGNAVKESDVEFKSDALIKSWWNGLPFVQWWNEKFGNTETEGEETGSETEGSTEGEGETVTE